MIAPRFTICLPYTLAQECPHPLDWSNPANFSNDAHDPGGKTMCGITQKEYDVWRKNNGFHTRDVRQISPDEGQQIYHSSYWLPDCARLPDGLDLSFFDESVNTGTTEATKILQFVLNVTVDGDWGSHTQAALNDVKDMATLIKAYALRRKTVYKEMPGFPYFGSDWISRATEIGEDSLKMIGAT